jgi:glycosyltransferase involved in cell wall biosynthesis
MAESGPTVSVVVPSRDERARLPRLVAVIESQTLQPAEVLVADGMSTDGSYEWLLSAAETRPWLRVVRNPARTIPAALNTALQHVGGDYIARMDTHAHYSPDYLEVLVGLLEERPHVVGAGGAMTSAGRGVWGRAIAAVLSNPIGMGGAPHRVGADQGPVDHVFTGCYRRADLLMIGGFDERLLANEDFELDFRLRRSRGALWLVPRARSTWFVPESLPELARKMYRYGRFKAVTMRLHPSSIRARQVAPPALAGTVTLIGVLRPRYGLVLGTVYLLCVSVAGSCVAKRAGASRWRAALVPSVLHVSWCLGLFRGLLQTGT